MSQGQDFTNGGGQFPDGRFDHPTGPVGPAPRSNPAAQPAWDPVTGLPLWPGPPAYSAVDPFAPQPPGYPGYPAAPGYQGYPAAAGYRLVPMYQMPPNQRPKPGGAVAAAVLAFVESGFALLGGVVLVAGGTARSAGDYSFGTDFGGELTLMGCIAVLAAALLIAGGTTVLNRKPALLTIGCAMSIAISIYFLIRLSDVAYGGATWLPIGYAVLPIIAIALTMSPDVRTWVRTRNTDAQ